MPNMRTLQRQQFLATLPIQKYPMGSQRSHFHSLLLSKQVAKNLIRTGLIYQHKCKGEDSVVLKEERPNRLHFKDLRE